MKFSDELEQEVGDNNGLNPPKKPLTPYMLFVKINR